MAIVVLGCGSCLGTIRKVGLVMRGACLYETFQEIILDVGNLSFVVDSQEYDRQSVVAYPYIERENPCSTTLTFPLGGDGHPHFTHSAS